MPKPDSTGNGTDRPRITTKQVVESTLRSGVIDTKQSVESLVNKIGGGIDEVAGYVLAWERYVLVVAQDLESPVIRFERR